MAQVNCGWCHFETYLDWMMEENSFTEGGCKTKVKVIKCNLNSIAQILKNVHMKYSRNTIAPMVREKNWVPVMMVAQVDVTADGWMNDDQQPSKWMD